MRDDAYALDLLPSGFRNLDFSAANAIEANLQYIILRFVFFSAVISTDALGSYGYLELTENAQAGAGFEIEAALGVDTILVFVTGNDLSALAAQGTGWTEKRSGISLLELAYSSSDFLEAPAIQSALDSLLFSASDDVDAEITLQVSNSIKGPFMPLGPVRMLFRSGCTWSLVEGKYLTWNAIEAADMTWNDLENLKK